LSVLILSLFLVPQVFAEFGGSPIIKTTLVSQTPDPVQPGEVFTVKFKVENEGEETNAPVIVRLSPKYPLSIYGDVTNKDIGILRSVSKGSDAIIVEYQLKVDENAAEGDVELELYLDTTDAGGRAYTNDEFMVNIETRDPILEISSIETSTDRIAPGRNAEVDIMLKNIADSLLRDVVITLDLDGDDIPFAPYQSTSERMISVLSSGFQKSVKFNVIAEPDAEDGLYKIPITITYTDEVGNEESLSDVIALQIGKQPKLKAFVKKSDIYKKGQEGTVTIGLANSNTGNINYLEIEILESDDFILTSPTSYFYIGDLDSDDTESEEISIYVKKWTKGVTIPVLASYGDDNNRQYQEQFDLDLKLYSGASAVRYGFEESQTKSLLSFFTFVAVVIVGWLYWKKRKKKKK